jgi:hypothetical protein
MRSTSPHGWRGSARIPLITSLAAACALAIVLGACAIGGATGGITPTDTPTASTDATATTTGALPTATSTHTGGSSSTATPTTPLPVLQGQVVTQGMGTINASSNSAITDVSCPAGYLVAGGGIASSATTFNTMTSAPISTTTWRAEIYNYGGSAISAQAQVSCLKLG